MGGGDGEYAVSTVEFLPAAPPRQPDRFSGPYVCAQHAAEHADDGKTYQYGSRPTRVLATWASAVEHHRSWMAPNIAEYCDYDDANLAVLAEPMAKRVPKVGDLPHAPWNSLASIHALVPATWKFYIDSLDGHERSRLV